ncbi:malonyl-ACP O-methyltransferase BioC [Methylomonas koyamae]|uniref:Malonyl-[acyl-carrier protein] O-methyltransferase n=1 Tax=Methylomonas koyamae TaxID=702114 RepID=A0AA91DC67_9GAMM|nr:malonyl-ACP O-methyltransferase BioC [Methylomonas koyamae]OAI25878.1 malonyl-[acyl-carrier protein] O-methyltransferase BioC [Methylomonas koyamae]
MVDSALLDKAKVRQSFAAAAEGYDALAGLQRRVGETLLAKSSCAASPRPLLDIGCGTGFLTRHLAGRASASVALDIALPMLQTARRNCTGLPAAYVCADAERLPFRDGSFGQIYSNLAVQWCEDLSALLADCRRVLCADGRLALSTFGPRTLAELKAAWGKVDDFAHVNEFYSVEQIRRFLVAAGWSRFELEAELVCQPYPSVLALMRELKGIGAHNASIHRNPRPTSRASLQRMIAHYEAAMAGGPIVASYEIIYLRAMR